jgi:hypothetical protein
MDLCKLDECLIEAFPSADHGQLDYSFISFKCWMREFR